MASTNETTAKGTLSYTDAMRIMSEFNKQMWELRMAPLALNISATWDPFGETREDRRIFLICQPSAIGDRTPEDTIERCTGIIAAIEEARKMAWFEGYEVAEPTEEEMRPKRA